MYENFTVNLIHDLPPPKGVWGEKNSIMNLHLQVWNHDFFWESMQPGGGSMPILGVLQQIEKDFGSFTNFREKFVEAALTLFGSGWVWLVCKSFTKLIFYAIKVDVFWISDLEICSLPVTSSNLC
jgi:superoxide dismutase